MKKILLLTFLVLFTANLSSQKKHKYQYNPVVAFSMEDGSTVRGYYLGEETRRGSIAPLDLRSTFVSFLYTDFESDKKKTVSASDVQKIVYYDGDEVTKIQEKIMLKPIDTGVNSSDKTTEAFEYLLYDGKLKLYGSNVFLCRNGGCMYSHANFYIKHSKKPYAVLAIKPKKSLTFKMGSSIENIVDAFRTVGGQCTAFNDYLNFFDKTIMQEQQLDHKLHLEYREIYKQTIKDLGKGRNLLRLDDEVAGRIQARQMEVFLGIISEYEKSCP